MTSFQRYMLNYLAARGSGCVRIAGLWLWPEDVRRHVPRQAGEATRELRHRLHGEYVGSRRRRQLQRRHQARRGVPVAVPRSASPGGEGDAE